MGGGLAAAVSATVDGPGAGVPWATDAAWRGIQDLLRRRIAHRASALTAAREHAATMAHWRDRLADSFDALAAETCGRCPDPCCRRAKVWLDFKDLLFIHLNGEALPPRQLRRDLRGPCRHLGALGCTLPHRSRPWICAWYVCPALHRTVVRDVPGGTVQIAALRRRVKVGRQAMEAACRGALGVLG